MIYPEYDLGFSHVKNSGSDLSMKGGIKFKATTKSQIDPCESGAAESSLGLFPLCSVCSESKQGTKENREIYWEVCEGSDRGESGKLALTSNLKLNLSHSYRNPSLRPHSVPACSMHVQRKGAKTKTCKCKQKNRKKTSTNAPRTH